MRHDQIIDLRGPVSVIYIPFLESFANLKIVCALQGAKFPLYVSIHSRIRRLMLCSLNILDHWVHTKLVQLIRLDLTISCV
jgi:hypothetical protein